MPPTDDPYSLQDLADLADVTPRTIRYYIAQGLLPSPSQLGPGARYGDRHLDRIRLIKLLQREHLPLAEIRSRLATMDDRQVAELAQSTAARRQPTGSAADYVRSVLGEPMLPFDGPPMVQMRALRTSAPAPAPATEGPSTAPPDRSQWDRITLTPDVELHVRRPLTRHHNKLVDRLIAAARQLFEEEPS
jgi:DNA-binding transcriptional MerR regulator